MGQSLQNPPVMDAPGTWQWLNWYKNVTTVVNNIGGSQINLVGDVSGSGQAGTNITTTLANSGVAAGTYNQVTVDAKGRVTSGSNQSYITGNQTVSLTGDATGSGTTSIPVTLATVATAGTYSNVTVNAKGLVTSGVTTLVTSSSPAASTTASDHSIPINCNGTTYYIRLSTTP